MNDSAITKTIRQYSKLLDIKTMSFLNGIAYDYRNVKSYVL